ncbi:hypothetical protein H6F89_30380 [Cyanobacteria bacterium FACHB-63]|nr:hypothetical protein [Cyanobacteria bacterium FACHB-63]
MLTHHRLKIAKQPRKPLVVRIPHNPELLAKYDRASIQALLRLVFK